MTAPELMSDCPTEETLAAFADNQLDPAQRSAVIEHLATCGDCRELVMLAMDVKASEELDELPRVAANVVPFRPRPWWVPAAGVAAAAVIVLSLTLTSTPEMEKLAKLSAGFKERPSEGRFAGDFPHKPKPHRFRGGGKPPGADTDDGPPPDIYTIAGDTKDPHVRGVAFLMIGDEEYLPKAIPELKSAYKQTAGDERDAVALDLAAALIRAGSDADLREALKLSEDIWNRKHLPVAAWNRAVALQMLIREDTSAAKRAWQDYLALDSTSEWADEARERLKQIDEQGY
jgi:hypothetical protein